MGEAALFIVTVVCVTSCWRHFVGDEAWFQNHSALLDASPFHLELIFRSCAESVKVELRVSRDVCAVQTEIRIELAKVSESFYHFLPRRESEKFDIDDEKLIRLPKFMFSIKTCCMCTLTDDVSPCRCEIGVFLATRGTISCDRSCLLWSHADQTRPHSRSSACTEQRSSQIGGTSWYRERLSRCH